MLICAELNIQSEHYKLSVGQGECITTISEISQNGDIFRVAVTADIGTCSEQTDPKYFERHNYQSFQSLYKTNTLSQPSPVIQHTHTPPVARPRDTTIHSSSNSTSLSRESDSDASHTGGASLKGVFDFLWEKFKPVDLWIVFLSHPDKDHINKFAEGIKKLPHIKVILICGGEWFNANSTEDIREVLRTIQENESRIFALFPYEDARPTTTNILDGIYDVTHPIEKKDPRSFNPKRLVNGVDLESIAGETFGELFHTPSSGTQKGSYSNRAKEFWDNFLSDFDEAKKELLFYEVLQKIRIWSFDHRPVNTNAQSLVWSHEVDDLGWTFVYTGDAENSTFLKIQRVLRNSVKKYNNVLDGKNLIMLQLMHHGSVENLSDLAFDLFAPNACAISAGNGTAFAHPHIDTITLARRRIATKNKFWKRYQVFNPHHPHKFSAFEAKGDGKRGKAVRIKIKQNHPPYFVPQYFRHNTYIENIYRCSIKYW